MKLSVAAAAVLAAASCGAAERNPAAPSSTTTASPAPVIVAFGDSLTAGPGLRPEQTYPSVLQQQLEKAGYQHRVVNAGVSGETTSDGVRRFGHTLTNDTRVVIIAMGANDGLRGVPLDTIRTNLSTMIAEAQRRGIAVLLCGMETPPLHGLRYSVDFHFLFPDLAAEHGVPLVPFMLNGVVGQAELNMEDGVHPNAKGAAVVAQNIYPFLLPLLSAAVFTA
jgi:acyl-CoA thioesterase-1